jgi:hypothetical protein
MQFGRSYEEFDVGAVYKHWPGKTVTEYDDHLFCLLTMNHHPLHLDSHYAQETTQFGQNVVVGNYIYSLLLGMSVADVSGKAIANLEVESRGPRGPPLHRSGQMGVEVQGRPGCGPCRDQGLQPGRLAGLHLPAQGDGPQEQLPAGPRRRPAGPSDPAGASCQELSASLWMPVGGADGMGTLTCLHTVAVVATSCLQTDHIDQRVLRLNHVR